MVSEEVLLPIIFIFMLCSLSKYPTMGTCNFSKEKGLTAFLGRGTGGVERGKLFNLGDFYMGQSHPVTLGEENMKLLVLFIYLRK